MTKVALHDETCSIFFEEKSHKKCDNKSAKKRGQKIGQKDETSNRAKIGQRKQDKKSDINTSDKINRTKIG